MPHASSSNNSALPASKGSPELDLALLRRVFLAPLWEQRARLLLLLFALILLSTAQGLFLFLVGPFLKTFFGPATGTSETLISLQSLFPHATQSHVAFLADIMIPRATLIAIVPGLIILAGLLKAFATYLYHLQQEALALWVAKRLRDRLFDTMLRLPYAEIRRRGAGEWMSVIMNDVLFLQVRYSDVMTTLVRDSVLVLACFVSMVFIHWPSALVLLAITPFGALALGRAAKRISWFAEAFQRELARIASAVLEMRARFDFFRAQHGEATEERRFNALNDRYYKVIRKSILIRSTLGPSMELGGYILFAGFLVAVAHGWLGSDPNASAETSEMILQFFAALGFLLRPMRNVGEQLTRFQETMGALSTSLETFRAFDRLNAARSDSVTPPAFSSHPRPWRGITLHRVGAAYGGRVAFVGENIRVAPSQCVAIIGPSGSGKSTFIKTLAGLIEPSTWDATIPWAELTNEGTLVSQEPFLFDDSLRDNLLYGLEQAGIKITPDDDSVNRALASVNIADEIERLPDKLSTRVRAISSNFSGGQLQRLVIARALLRDKPLWLLDEATSAVDARTEKDITFRLIDAARRERKSLLMVTHRLRWLNAFDTIFFVEQGKILAAGSHVELQQHPVHGTRYRRFCQTAEDTSGEAR